MNSQKQAMYDREDFQDVDINKPGQPLDSTHESASILRDNTKFSTATKFTTD